MLYKPHLNGKDLVISFATLAELYRWSLDRNWGIKKCDELQAHLLSYAIHPYNEVLCMVWARIVHARKKAGRPISPHDAWIAATAVQHAIPLVTHNRKDFQGIDGLTVISEAPE